MACGCMHACLGGAHGRPPVDPPFSSTLPCLCMHPAALPPPCRSPPCLCRCPSCSTPCTKRWGGLGEAVSGLPRQSGHKGVPSRGLAAHADMLRTLPSSRCAAPAELHLPPSPQPFPLAFCPPWPLCPGHAGHLEGPAEGAAAGRCNPAHQVRAAQRGEGAVLPALHGTLSRTCNACSRSNTHAYPVRSCLASLCPQGPPRDGGAGARVFSRAAHHRSADGGCGDGGPAGADGQVCRPAAGPSDTWHGEGTADAHGLGCSACGCAPGQAPCMPSSFHTWCLLHPAGRASPYLQSCASSWALAACAGPCPGAAPWPPPSTTGMRCDNSFVEFIIMKAAAGQGPGRHA